MKVTTLACIQGAWTPGYKPQNILDIGAGTGVLSLMSVQKYKVPCDAVEIEENAYDQLKENIAQSPWRGLITSYYQDIRSFAQKRNNKYDFIITNPPFFEGQLLSEKPKQNIARHEAGLTLQDLLMVVSDLLTDHGRCSILLPARESDILLEHAEELSLFSIDKLLIQNTAEKASFATVTILSKNRKSYLPQKLVIRGGRGDYTEEFKSLLKPYYLNL